MPAECLAMGVNSLKLAQVGIGSRMAERAAHRHNLPLVMERMREDVMENERGRTDGGVSVGKMKICIGDELEISQA